MRDQPEETPARIRGEAARDSLAIAVAALVALAVLRPLQDAPFVDDWTYAWSVDNLLRGRGLEVLEWSTHANVVQVLWGALFCLPFGFSFTALRASTWVLATSGLVATYLLLRQLGAARRDALIGTAVLGANPIYFALGFTFMTDVPFVVLATWSALAMAIAVRRGREAWLAAAAVGTCLAVGVRTVGAVLPVAMALALVTGSAPAGAPRRWGRHPRRVAIALSPLLFLAAIVWWRSGHVRVTADITGVGDSPAVRLQNLAYALPLLPASLVQALGSTANVLGLGLLPLVLAGLDRAGMRRTGACAAALGLTLALGATAGLALDPPLVAGSIWAVREVGAAELLVPGAEPAPSRLATWALVPVAVLSAGHVLATLLRRRPLLASEAFLAWVVVGQFLLVALLWLFYDRYLLALLAPALVLLLSRQPVRRPRIAMLAVGGLAILSVVGVRDHLAYTGAVWAAVDDLRALGARDAEINAGYAASGWLHYAHPDNAPRGPDGTPRVPWINGAKDEPLRYWVSNSPVPGYETVGTVPYRRWLAPSGRIYLLERRAPG